MAATGLNSPAPLHLAQRLPARRLPVQPPVRRRRAHHRRSAARRGEQHVLGEHGGVAIDHDPALLDQRVAALGEGVMLEGPGDLRAALRALEHNEALGGVFAARVGAGAGVCGRVLALPFSVT